MSSKARSGSSKTDMISLQPAAAGEPALATMLFDRVPEEDISQYQQPELLAASALAVKALQNQKPGQCPITINHSAVTRNGEKVTVITLVSDNKPFLFDSVMGEIGTLVSDMYLVTHLVLNMTNSESKATVSLAGADEPADKRRINLMQIHVPALNKGQSEKLRLGLETVVNQVNAATRDWKPMLACLSAVTAQYRGNPPDGHEKEAARLADFLGWLMDDNFLFLGMREYPVQTAAHTGESAKAGIRAHGTNLGILTDASLRLVRDPLIEQMPKEAQAFMEGDSLLLVTKAKARSKVHRRVLFDYIGVKLFDYDGSLKGELRIFGLFTATAYSCPIMRIPYLRPKVEQVIRRLGYSLGDHAGRMLLNILESYPRDELFRMGEASLAKNAGKILALMQRPRIRVLVNEEASGHSVSVLVFIPRDRYDSIVREKIGCYLVEVLHGESFEFTPFLLNSGLTRVHYVVRRKKAVEQEIAQAALEAAVTNIVSTWGDQVAYAAAHEQVNPQITALASAFPESYRDSFNARVALQDAALITTLSATKDLEISFYNPVAQEKSMVYLKLFHRNTALKLSQRVPVLENMGFRVIAEQTLCLPDGAGGDVYLHNIALEKIRGKGIDPVENSALLAETFEAIWAGNAENDAFNGLTLAAGMEWRKIVVLRALARYLQQTGLPYEQAALAQGLSRNPAIAHDLYELFRLKFDPACQKEDAARQRTKSDMRLETAIQALPALEDEQMMRAFHGLIAAGLRSNAYLPEKDGRQRRTLAFTFDPQKIDVLPHPRPYRESFVYGPEVEGIYLRFGAVARGGVCRLKQRHDYRGTVLARCKGQQLCNAVVVPAGAGGAFYATALPYEADDKANLESTRLAYGLYVTALLSVMDNYHNGKIVPAEGLLRYDGDDAYLVMAAGDGTEAFADTANGLSEAQGFWLEDAFATGYDHRKTGITAKGAWDAVKQHFRTFGRNIQTSAFTVAGVGNMGDDMFGNGMLQTRTARLVAAFDERDIFIDPNPDAAAAYEERKRLFAQEKSGWQDYNRGKLSTGGGIFSRAQKSITLSPEAAQAIGFSRQSGTPAEIIRAILQAEVDLLWFGAEGTYVRASYESDAQIGERANDSLRISVSVLRAGVVGEAAGSGLTQGARVEYTARGGRCNIGVMDHAAGVSASDIEVNSRIVLGLAGGKKKLSREERNKFMKKAAPDIAALALRNAARPLLALSLAEKNSLVDLPYQSRFIGEMERACRFDRQAEGLPDNQILVMRQAQRQGLNRPELAVMMAYAKSMLKQDILASPSLINDPYLDKSLAACFPAEMRKAYAAEMAVHPLRKEIIATALANDIINHAGMTYIPRLADKTGQSTETIIRAYILVRDGFDLTPLYDDIAALDDKVSVQTQISFQDAVAHMLQETSGWILRNIQLMKPLDGQVATTIKARQGIEGQLQQIIPDYLRQDINRQIDTYKAQGAPAVLAQRLAMLRTAALIPEIALIASKAGSELFSTAQTHFALAETFRLNRMVQAGHNIPIVDYYDGVALSRANDTITDSMRRMVVQVLDRFRTDKNPVEAWLKSDATQIDDVVQQMNTLIDNDLTVSRYTIAAGMIADLAGSENR